VREYGGLDSTVQEETRGVTREGSLGDVGGRDESRGENWEVRKQNTGVREGEEEVTKGVKRGED
jgi:hypothetical protein